MRNVKFMSWLVVLVLLLAACGGGGGGGNNGGGEQGTEGGTNTTEGTGSEGDAEGAGNGQSGQQSGAQEVVFEAGNELRYNPETATAPVGEVTITLNNTGALEHNIVWENDPPDQPFVHTTGGETDSNTRTFDAPGEYGFYCSVAGHQEAGMVGTLTIQ